MYRERESTSQNININSSNHPVSLLLKSSKSARVESLFVLVNNICVKINTIEITFINNKC